MGIEEEKQEQLKIYNYWMNCIQRAEKKQPRKLWESAEVRYNAGEKTKDEDKRPFVNDLRKLHESSLAFLDQQEPSFKASPGEAWLGNDTAVQKAKCDSLYLKYVWREQKCQQVESRKLNSALLRNNGNVIVEFDLKKWMPSLRYLPSRNVLWDPDCDGLIEKANWCGYFEDISAEQFRSWNPEIPEAEFNKILEKAGSTLTEEEKEGVSEEYQPMYATIKVYHIFARNSAAVRKIKDDKTEIPDKTLAEKIQLNTPRRYFQFVNGYPKPVVDRDFWPFDLDHEEYPISLLQFNHTEGNFYAFTDYKQMERLDLLSDDMMRDLGIASFWAAVRKWAAGNKEQIDKVQLDNFLNDPNESFLPDMLDPEGKPKVAPLDRGEINPGLIELYKMTHDQSKEASALSELLENAEAQSYKDVTALAARIVDANMHQRVNRRLGGPWGYEKSIAEDAIKILEVAHQMVPQFSSVSIMKDGEEALEENIPWPKTVTLLGQGATLIKLGVDSIVGPELAQVWGYKEPPQQWRLSTKVVVEPGTTRSITKEQQAAIMKQLYVEVFAPFYQLIGAVDLMREFLEMIGKMAQVPNIDNLLPDETKVREAKEQLAAQKQAEMEAAAAKQTGEQGGQPLNSPEATGGEVQGEQVI